MRLAQKCLDGPLRELLVNQNTYSLVTHNVLQLQDSNNHTLISIMEVKILFNI